jgi:FAS-associated factor 2
MRYLPSYPTSFLSLLAYPLHFISSIFRFIFGVLRIPIPQLPFTSLNFYRPLPSGPSDPRSVADRWVRALEEETGAVCISRAGVAAAGASSGTDAGPSSLTSRTGGSTNDEDIFEEGRKLLPDFTLGSYEEVLRMCQRETKIACIILVSDEHDDVAEFKR